MQIGVRSMMPHSKRAQRIEAAVSEVQLHIDKCSFSTDSCIFWCNEQLLRKLKYKKHRKKFSFVLRKIHPFEILHNIFVTKKKYIWTIQYSGKQ